jgi:hypothetical protein
VLVKKYARHREEPENMDLGVEDHTVYIEFRQRGFPFQELEILESKFSTTKGCRFSIFQNSKDKLLQPLMSKLKVRWNDADQTHQTLHVSYAKN